MVSPSPARIHCSQAGAGAGADLPQQREQFIAVLRLAPTQAFDGGRETLVGNRLQQIIHRGGAKSFHRELVVGGDKHDLGVRRQRGGDFQAGHAWQANIQKGDIGPGLARQAQRFAALGRHADNLKLRP